MAETPKCLNILVEAIKKTRFMDEASARNLLKDLKKRAKIKQQKVNISERDALQQTSDEMVKEQEERAKLRERNAYLDLAALVTINDFTKKGVFKSRAQGLNAALTGDLGYKRSQRNSMYLAMRNTAAELNGDLSRSLRGQGLLKRYVDDKDFQNLVAEELHNMQEETALQKSGSVTGDDNAFAAAQSVAAVQEKARKLFNKVGGNIKKGEGFIATTTHDINQMLSATGSQLKDAALFKRLISENRKTVGLRKAFAAASEEMKRLAYVRWRDFYIPLLNRNRTFRDTLEEDVERFMKGSYDALVSGRHLKSVAEDTGTLTDFKKIQSVSRADRFSMGKVFFPKSGRAWMTYNDKYGTGSLATSVYHGLVQIGKNIGIMKKFGPSSTKNYNTLVADIEADESQRLITGPLKGTKENIERGQHMWNFATGRTQIPVNQVYANWMQSFRDVQSLIKLPLVVITAFQDVANRASEFRLHGMGFFERWRAVFQQTLKGLSAEKKQDIASLFRVWSIGDMGVFTSRMAAFDSPKGALSKAMQLFWKFNGMNRWDRVNTEAHALSLGAHLGSLRDSKFTDLDPLEQRLLLQYDIDEPEWDYYRKNATFVAGADDTVFIAPDIVRQKGNIGLDDYLDAIKIADKTDAARENAQDELSDKLGQYFIDRTAHAILIPDLRDSTILLGSSRPGTNYGEFFRSVRLFKSFSISYARKIIGRALIGGNLAGNPDILGILEITATSTLLGMAILDLKELGQGKEPKFINGGYVLSGMLQGGGLGIWGDFLFGEYNRFGQSPAGTFGGPVLGTLSDMASLFASIVRMDHPAQAAFQFFNRNTPLINMYFAHTALNYLFLYSLAEHISPGYLARKERAMAKNQDEQFIFSPQQFALRPFG